MSVEEYRARQQANAAQNQVNALASALNQRTMAARHLKRALELLDREQNPEAYGEVEQALAALT